MSLTNKVKRFAGSSAYEKGMITRTLFWLWYFRLRNMILPYRMTKKWISQEIAETEIDEIRNEKLIKEVTGTVRRCKHYVPGATCLTQALATRAILNHYGQRSNIRLGVARSDVSIDAHAWVEIDGRIILGRQPNNARYSLLRPPSPF